MNTERLTTRSRDALTAAVRQALTKGNPNTEPEHLLHGLLLTPTTRSVASCRPSAPTPRSSTTRPNSPSGSCPPPAASR
ncbi:hypothetical protein G7085_08175 [Tessaracoccus sp. HDW20]|nr:hypothetical protein [Tessaracoccus coleopterorum]